MVKHTHERGSEMMTEKALSKLNAKQLARIEDYRSKRCCGIERLEKEAAESANGYTKALFDSGIITDRERMILYIYTSIPDVKRN